MTWFWIWLFLTLALCLWPVVRAYIYPAEAIAFPFVAALMWLYFYVYLPYQAITHLGQLLPAQLWALAQFLACGSFASLLVGWHLGQSHPRPSKTQPFLYNLDRLWAYGLGWLALGNLAMYSFAGSGRTFEETSAYWYALVYVGYAGIALCVLVLALRPRPVGPFRLGLFILLAYLLISPSVFGARRGPTFVAIIATVVAYLLVRAKPVRPFYVAAVLAVAGIMMLGLVEARRYISRGQSWLVAFEQMSIADVMEKRTKGPGDNEFINHCVQIQANLQTGQYQFGSTHLAMLVHWVPRALWPTKPHRGAGMFPEARHNYLGSFSTNLGYGGSWGTVADTFDNYWYFGFVFWLMLGWLLSSFYRRVGDRQDVAWKMHYLGFLMASHWLIAQCLPEALVPCLFFQAVFWLSFKHSKVLAPAVALIVPVAGRPCAGRGMQAAEHAT